MQALARQVYRECVTCARFAARTLKQITGNLSASRVDSICPLLACGVNYAGPIMLRATKGRDYQAFKGYMFLATKAVHLEAVSDLNTPGLLDAYGPAS